MNESKSEKVTQKILPLKMENIAPIGELMVGGSSADYKLYLTALCILDNPNVNNFFLHNKLKFKDRLTGTVIFPREGMVLPNGQTYAVPEIITNKEQTNVS